MNNRKNDKLLDEKVTFKNLDVESPRLSTRGREGVKVGSNLVHVVVEWPLMVNCFRKKVAFIILKLKITSEFLLMYLSNSLMNIMVNCLTKKEAFIILKLKITF